MTREMSISIVVTPRERFSVAEESLDSILAHSERPYQLIYVDGGAPAAMRSGLERRAREHGFDLIRRDAYLSPNAARNFGLARATGKYVVFVDNDVVVSPRWLTKLVECAEQTGAVVVSPLICQGSPVHEVIHCAGGVCGIREEKTNGRAKRYLFERIARQGQCVAAVRHELARGQTELAEFHCMLVRKDYLDYHGPLDEAVLNTREHVDFCIEVARDSGSVWLEPESIVTYRFDVPLTRADLRYYMLRWGDRWERQSLEHLQRKYDLDVDAALHKRLAHIGWRRREYVLKPFVRSVTRGIGGRRVEKALVNAVAPAERLLNRALYALNDRKAADAIDG